MFDAATFVPPTKEEDERARAFFNRYAADWQHYDFYVYNPVNRPDMYMDYPTYCRKRDAGEIPAPDHAKVLDNIINWDQHKEIDGA